MEKLKISENGRYFVKSDGTPFVWLADTVWTMPQRMKWDDVTYLMQKRKSQGFTVLQIVALDPEMDVDMRIPAGEKALLNNCLDTPNEAYFKYLDWILDTAEAYGFYVLLLPAWGQLIVGDNWAGKTFPKTATRKRTIFSGVWEVTGIPSIKVLTTKMYGAPWQKDWQKDLPENLQIPAPQVRYGMSFSSPIMHVMNGRPGNAPPCPTGTKMNPGYVLSCCSPATAS